MARVLDCLVFILFLLLHIWTLQYFWLRFCSIYVLDFVNIALCCLLVLGQANSSNRRREPSWFAVLYSSWRSIKTDIRIGMVMRKLFTWELSVRVCQDEWVRVCVLQDKKGEETLLVRPRTTYWASRTSSERARTRETSRTWQHNHQGQVCRETSHTLWSWTR